MRIGPCANLGVDVSGRLIRVAVHLGCSDGRSETIRPVITVRCSPTKELFSPQRDCQRSQSNVMEAMSIACSRANQQILSESTHSDFLFQRRSQFAVRRVAVTVPVELGHAQRQSIITALDGLGMSCSRLVPLPVAACAGMELDRSSCSRRSNAVVLCLDFGEHVSRATLISIDRDSRNQEVLATHAAKELSLATFDTAINDLLLDYASRFVPNPEMDASWSQSLRHSLVKERTAFFEVRSQTRSACYSIPCTRWQYERLCSASVTHMVPLLVKPCLGTCRLPVNHVVSVGHWASLFSSLRVAAELCVEDFNAAMGFPTDFERAQFPAAAGVSIPPTGGFLLDSDWLTRQSEQENGIVGPLLGADAAAVGAAILGCRAHRSPSEHRLRWPKDDEDARSRGKWKSACPVFIGLSGSDYRGRCWEYADSVAP